MKVINNIKQRMVMTVQQTQVTLVIVYLLHQIATTVISVVEAVVRINVMTRMMMFQQAQNH